MPYESRVNPYKRPQEYGNIELAGGESPKNSRRPRRPWIVLAIVAIIAALAIAGFSFKNQLTAAPSDYQAVFLTNGQVYFGKLSEAREYVVLKDVYYLQVIQPPLQGQQQPSQQPQQQISLVKLGNELHGPKDEMKISRSQILFYEDLRSDGKVVQAIRNYQANPPK